MEISGTQMVPAPRAQVWDALNDPAILKLCLPGCESVERTSADTFRVVVAMAIGPLRARFTGTLRMTESDAPRSCVMVFEGQGGAVGFGKGSTSVTLNESSAGTELAYSAKAQVGGKLAQVGSRLIDNVAKKLSDDFFAAFRKQLAPAEASGIADTSAVHASESSAAHPSDAGMSAACPSRVATSDAATSAERVAPPAGTASSARTTAVPPVVAPAAPHALAPTPARPYTQAPAARVMVPGWWLAVAMLLGVFATLTGAHWVH